MQLLPDRPDRKNQPAPEELTIFIGLDTSSIQAARKADTRHTVIMGITLLFVGFTGIMLIFLVQSYRSTRTSLSRVRAFSDNLVANLPIGLVAVDGDETIVTINHVACRILGVSSVQATGAPAKQMLPADLHGQLTDLYSRTGALDREIDCAMGPGRYIPMEIFLSRLMDENGASGGAMVLFRDLSDVRALQREIVRSQRLASLGKLAAGVAHEVRNPLSSIKGFATYFKEKYPEVAEDQHIASIMVQEVDRLNRVVSQLLDLARPVAIHPKPVPVQMLIENALKLAQRRAAEKNIDIRQPAPADVGDIFADPDSLSQVLLNLVLNAVDAMEPGGSLSVAVERDRSGNGCWIRVSDSGPGIAPEHLPHIFDPYFTTKPDGTGLGLAIAHNIIEAHHGQITAESQPGQGTVVSIFLPDAGKART